MEDNLWAERRKAKADGGTGDEHEVIRETMLSPEGSIELSPPAKGYGLKKWRRIRRDVNQEGSTSSADSTSKVLKQRAPNLRKPATTMTTTVAKDSSSVITPNNNNLAVGPRSVVAENREDRHASNSANAVVENTWDNKNNLSANKSLGKSSFQHKGKGKLEMTSKKARGERVKIDKENSHSSMGSDSRISFNFVFMQEATNSRTSKGRQSPNYDGENSDEAQGGQQPFLFLEEEEESSSFREDDVGADSINWEIKEEEIDNSGSSMDRDSLIDSITMLDSAQEALEKEIQKLREIGCGDALAFDDSELNFPNPKVDEPSSSDVLQLSEVRPDSPRSLESQMIVLKQNVNILESKLEEANATLEVKEAKVMELEANLNDSSIGSRSARKSTGLNVDSEQGEDREILDTELESLFKQKIEAEVEHLVISRTIQKLRVAAVGQIELLEDAEIKATMLKRRADKLETSCTAADNNIIIETDEVFKLQKRICKLTSCFFIQLILLVVVVGLFVLQLSPPYGEDVVPT